MKNKIINSIISKAIGFLIFLILIGIANIIAFYIKEEILLNIVGFLNKNIWLILIFNIVFLIGEIFNYLNFPLNIPAPLFNGVGGVLLIEFIFYIFDFLSKIGNIIIPLNLNSIKDILILIAFIIIIIVGYYNIVKSAISKKDISGQKKTFKRHNTS